MLLRSSSTPILNSWIPPHYYNHSCTYNSSKDSSPSPDHNINELHLPQLIRTKSISTLSHDTHPLSKPVTSTLFDTQHLDPPPLPKRTCSTPLQRLFSSSGLDEAVSSEEESGGGDGNSGGGFNGCGNSSNNYHGRGSVEAYYNKMIEVNPGNSLLLANYASFLKQINGDVAKAEEYCGRALLASPSDANVLSLYAEIIWLTQRDSQRAETYFDHAVNSAPNDCYVLASYAKFLWEMEEEKEEYIGDAR